MRFIFASVMSLLLSGGAAVADEPKPVELTLRARAIETPVLKYRLLPSEANLKPGNAVPILLRLPWEQLPFMNKVFPTLHEWESRPLDAPEWSTFNALPQSFYGEMKRAAYRRDASWEYPIGETPSPYLILLPDVQGLRGFLGHGLSAKIRYHLSRGELDKAREGILVGFANSRHLSQTPFYINQLVALAIHRIMLDRTGELISQPDSPNLYWALSTLPDSLLRMDRAASFESELFAMTFPAVNDLDRPRDAAEWDKMARQLVDFLEALGEIPKQEPVKPNGSVVEQFLQRLMPPEKTHLAKAVKQARADLPQLLGIPAAKVAAMTDEEAGIRWYAHLRMARDQHASAVFALTPREAWPELRRLQGEDKLIREQTGTKGWEFLNSTSIYVSVWSLKRRIHMLRIIEAVRHHMATHEGEFPGSLDEIKDVPVPLDPLTDRPFEWKVDGQVATLKAPPLPADVVSPKSAEAAAGTLEYRLRGK